MKKSFGAPKGEQKGANVSRTCPSQKGSKTLTKGLDPFAHQKVSVGARLIQSEQAYWVLKVLTFLTPFCKTFLLTNTHHFAFSNEKIGDYYTEKRQAMVSSIFLGEDRLDGYESGDRSSCV